MSRFLISLASLVDFFVISMPVPTLQPVSPNGQGADPAEDGNAAEEAPGEGFALGLHVRGEGEETAGEEGADAAPGGGKGLRDAV